MYLEIYGIKKSPFNITADPGFFYESVTHKEALAALLYGIQEKKGIVLITGEVGTGKTTLCKTLLNRLDSSIKTSVMLSCPSFSHTQLLQAIVEDFGIKPLKKSRFDIIKQLNSFLIDVNLSGSTAVLIIDEAQNLSPSQLEHIRLLSNLETAQEKLLQIVLVGQPELADKLNQPKLRQISQRIFVKHSLRPLKSEEVKRYIEHRLNISELEDFLIMPESYDLIFEFSKGIPRLINMLCDRALLLGFVKNCRVFDAGTIKACIEELK
ncbi:MAG: AAA family ATPase [Candidatus Omnitrophica bacterium]|nr:AAA family ATPase [Candidatus Omnitrophota bacterium]